MIPHPRHHRIVAAALALLLTASLPSHAQLQDPTTPAPNLERFIKSRDRNEDGKISPQEMFESARKRLPDANDEAALRRMAMSIRFEFSRIDADRDGHITAGELKADRLAAKAHKESIAMGDAKLFEGRFSQCSYNALSSALIHFHGATPKFEDRKEMESLAFREPLKSEGFGGFHGWAPWTSYMVNSGMVQWNGEVTDLKAENFSLRPAELPVAHPRKRQITVNYAPGERDALEKKLRQQLERGPVVIWTPYASVLSPIPHRWKHVEHVDNDTDVVPFGSFTHAVTVFPKDGDNVMVVDGSTPDGVFYTDLRTVVATSSAMPAFIRIPPPGDKKKSVFDRCRGIEGERWNVVVFREEKK